VSAPPSLLEPVELIAGTDDPNDAAVDVCALLTETVLRGASDLLLVAGARPTVFADGQWSALDAPVLDGRRLEPALMALLTEERRIRLVRVRDLDFGISDGGGKRYRVNLHYQRGTLAAAFRTIPATVPAFDSLNLPPQVIDFAEFPHGLVLVTGGTGQGKSTTVATMIDHLNHARAAHVITVEDPIEFAFAHGTCTIEQREIGDDSPDFATALRHVLRQRPDVIVIGELRDLETISTALTAAETGHLVIASLHTSGAVPTMARIIDAFPSEQQPQVRTQLAASLRAIACQTLLRCHGAGLVPATEVLVATPAVRRAIRENETHLIASMLETGRSQGMHSLEQSLAALVKSGIVSAEEAASATSEPARLGRLIGHPVPAAISADAVMSGEEVR